MPGRSNSFGSCLATAVTAALALGMTASAAWAADGTTDAMSGQVVVIDKQTGKLRGPTAEEAAELAAKSRKSSDTSSTTAVAPTVHISASGVMSAELGEEYESTEIAQIGPDGKLVYSCIHGPEAAKSQLTNPPAALETE